MNPISLGLLEFGYHQKNTNSLSVIQDVIDYVVKADELGFSRVWLTEHHNFYRTSPWSNPEMLLPVLLGSTDRIRIGMAGILINYHSPYRVALNFKLLANLFPRRVDLGLANGTPPEHIARMLRQKKFRKRPDDYYKHTRQVHRFFEQEEAVAVEEKVIIPPLAGLTPDLFVLASFFSAEHIEKALELKLHFSKSLFHDTRSLTREYDQVALYREKFFRKYDCLPQVNIALPVICAENEQAAKTIAERSGEPVVVNTLMGPADKIHDTLCHYQEVFGVDEFILYDKSFHPSVKTDTLYQLSQKFNISSTIKTAI